MQIRSLAVLKSLLMALLSPLPQPPWSHCLDSVNILGGEVREEGISSRVLLAAGCVWVWQLAEELLVCAG